jgi:RNA polymerase sigma-70 factor (ECF subfamily)
MGELNREIAHKTERRPGGAIEIDHRKPRVPPNRMSTAASALSPAAAGLPWRAPAPQDRSRNPGPRVTMPRDVEESRALAAMRDERSDEELMVDFREGDPGAFELLVVRHRRALFNFLLRSVGRKARAEELLQEVFLRVIRARDRYERTARFRTWLFTIARNLCVDESRRQKFRRHKALEAKSRGGDGLSIMDRTAAAQPGVDAQAEGPSIRQRIAAAVDALPSEQREVFLMRQIGGLSFKQIGAAVDAPENTVKSRMRYALEKLRTELADIDPRAIAENKESASG